MDTVGIRQLSIVVTVYYIQRIAFLVSLLIRLLDATTAGGIVAGHRKAYHTAVGQVDRPLDKPLAEGASPDNDTSVLILDGSAENLGCRSAVLVDEYYDLAIEEPVACAAELLGGNGTSAGIDDEVVLGEEEAGNLGCGIEVATAVLLLLPALVSLIYGE